MGSVHDDIIALLNIYYFWSVLSIFGVLVGSPIWLRRSDCIIIVFYMARAYRGGFRHYRYYLRH